MLPSLMLLFIDTLLVGLSLFCVFLESGLEIGLVLLRAAAADSAAVGFVVNISDARKWNECIEDLWCTDGIILWASCGYLEAGLCWLFSLALCPGIVGL